MQKQELHKLAAVKLRELNADNKKHEKRAHALRLLYKQSELGYGDVPRTYRELDEKIASLMNEDLNVVEKALEMTGGNLKLGELASSDHSGRSNPEDQFQASIMNGNDY